MSKLEDVADPKFQHSPITAGISPAPIQLTDLIKLPVQNNQAQPRALSLVDLFSHKEDKMLV